jgi:hypothetical protein
MLNSLIGIIASSGGAVAAGAYESIATVTVGAGGSSSISFSSIPSTYQHLQIRAIARDTEASSGFNNGSMTFNSDTAANYSAHQLIGNGSTVASNGYASQTSINVALYVASTGLTSGIFSGSVIDILDYANINKNKTTRTLSGGDANGSGVMLLTSGNWRSTSAITSITLNPSTGNFVQYSSFALYGIKGA